MLAKSLAGLRPGITSVELVYRISAARLGTGTVACSLPRHETDFISGDHVCALDLGPTAKGSANRRSLRLVIRDFTSGPHRAKVWTSVWEAGGRGLDTDRGESPRCADARAHRSRSSPSPTGRP